MSREYNFEVKEISEGVRTWYLDAVDGGWDYVVFVVRRSYMQALLMERETGHLMKEIRGTVFLTDAALFLHCDEIAEFFRENRRFPRILLLDDTLVHGRKMNHLLKLLETELYERLKGSFTEIEVRKAMMDTIRLQFYARLDGELLLDISYLSTARCYKTMNKVQIHNLSEYLSAQIVQRDIANACYVYSQYLDKRQFEEADLQEYKVTRYQRATQYTKVVFVGTEKKKKGILTLRIMKNQKDNDGYRMVPLVFLPNLDGGETMRLLDSILERMRQSGMPEEAVAWIRELDRIEGKRVLNEIITMILSMSILQEFNRTNRIEVDPISKQQEIEKLARNYDRDGFGKACRFVESVVDTQLFTVEELKGLIERCVTQERIFLSIEDTSENGDRKAGGEAVRRRIEDHFHEQGRSEEIEAMMLGKARGYSIERKRERYVSGNGYILSKLFEGCGAEEAQYGVAYYLQMMDAGILGLSSFPSQRVRVVGFSQFAKAGEQSQLIMPLRYYEWLPMLAEMEGECANKGLVFREEMEQYSKSGYCDLGSHPERDPSMEELVSFVEGLHEKGDRVEDWLGNFMRNIEVYDDDDPKEQAMAKYMSYLLERIKHEDNYELFCRERQGRSGF